MVYTRELLGDRFKEYRLDLGFGQDEVSRECNIAQSVLSNFERNAAMGIDTFISLLNFYGKYYKVSNLLASEFIMIKNNEPTPFDEYQSKVISEITTIENYMKTRMLNLRLLASGDTIDV